MKTILDFAKAKNKEQKITMLTCYDYTFAKILNKSSIDTLLVGDSVSQVVYGNPTTLHANMNMMIVHTEAVRRGAPDKFIVSDMPFLSTRKSLKYAVTAAGDLLKAGANSVKIEGADGHLELIKYLTESGIPVMGHLGLTPQSIHQLGGPKIQGRTLTAADKMLADALDLEKANSFSLVLECIPHELAKKISEHLHITTIGIGAGSKTSGQVLVLHDMLGLNSQFNPQFLRKFADFEMSSIEAIEKYILAVQKNEFPTLQNSYE